jgi:Mrp family chromosome partitioning ATPase
VDLRLSRRPLAPELEKLQAAWPYILIYAPSLLNQPHLLLAAPGDTPLISLVQYGKATLEDLDEVIARSESCHFRFAGVVLHHFPTKRLRNRRNIFGLGPHRYVFDERLKPARV